MANLSENPQWVDSIYQIETSDPVVGGPDGVSNRQAKELASRTRYLKKEQEKTGSDLATHAAAADPHTQYAPKANPTFTGMPKAPTPATDNNSQQVATTAFVKSVVATLINGAPAALDTLQELAKSLGNDPNFSATVLNAIADVKAEAANKLNAHNVAADPHTQYAPKASPVLTGKPTAPTAAQASNDTQVATTAFVKAAVAALVNGSPAALDTLQELANALGNDPQFSTTVLNALAGKLAKDQNGADIADKNLFVKNIGAARAFHGAINIGGDSGAWKTSDFIAWLKNQGAFNHPYWICKGSWSYANNKIITDTGVGNIQLAGSVIEVFGVESATTIRVTTPSTVSAAGAIPNANFTYINHGDNYSPGWRRDYNTRNPPTAIDVGTYTKAETDTRVTAATAIANNAATSATNANTNANGRVPSGRMVNGKALSADISLAAGDVGAYTKAETDTRVASATTVANNAATAAVNANTNANGRVPSGRMVNGKALSSDIALNAGDIGALSANGTAVAAAKLATPRKINGVAFDGSADINFNLGLKLKALGQFSPMNGVGVEFTAVNANILRCYITRQDQGYYVELGMTKMVLVDATLTDVISAPYVRRRLAGSFPVTKITMDNGLNASNGMWEINYPNHGIATGSKKSFYIMGLVYREVGMRAIGQVADIDGLNYQMNVELDTPVSNPRVPIIAYAESELSAYFAIPIQVYGRKNFVNQRFGSIAHADFLDNSHISVCVSDNNTDGIITPSMVTIMVYDL
ncbi:hypothetical protein R0L47_04160 [Pectobacterium polonicum]|uniref:hypothetical protein n=1 Tax=Pectobacterium polonicum TaxID=2485124 RepID=UPI001F4F788C|nr:hypothetical protein [Pectobacterium polonicum]